MVTASMKLITAAMPDDQSIFFEVKPGPYDPATVVEFADWSPAEETAEVHAFYEKLLAVDVGEAIS